MKKLTSIIIALAAITTTVSCTKGADEQSAPAQTYVAEKLSVAGYKKENLTLPEGMNQVYSFMPYNGCNDYLLLGAGTRIPEFWHADGDFSEFETVEFPEFDIGVKYDLDTANDGTVVVFVVHADYGDLPSIGLYEYPEGYDEETYDNAAEYTFMIKTFSADGKLLSETEVEDFGVEPVKNTSINGVYSDGTLVIAEISGAYEMFDVNGKYLGELTTDMGDIDSIGHSIDGGLICAVTYTEEETDKMKLCSIGSDGRLTDLNNTVYDFQETVKEIMPSTGEYSVLVRTRTSIYGIKSDNSEIIPLFAVINSGVNTEAVQGFLLMDGKVAVMENDHKSYKVNFKKYTPRTEEEMAGIPVVTLGTYGDSMFLSEYVNEWNDAGKEFMVEIKVYDSDSDKEEEIFDEISQDAIAGELPDILYVHNGYFGDINLREMGALQDLYTFIDKEEVYNRDYFIPSVLSYFEYNGELSCLPHRFSVSLGTVGKTKFLGAAENWSSEKKLDLIIDPPIDIEMESDSKSIRRSYMYDVLDNWVDLESGACDFKKESFYRFLNWCNEPEEMYAEYNYKSPEEWTDEDQEASFVKQQRRYIDDKAIFSDEGLVTYENYVDMTRGTFGGEELTYIEEPTLHGDTPLAISAKSENKEMAWEFIKSRFTDEYYESYFTPNGFTGPFPITKTGLKMYENWERNHYRNYAEIDGFKSDPEWRDYKGIVYSWSFFDYSKSIKLGEITNQDVSEVNAFIAKAKPKKKSIDLEAQFYDIAYEEMDRFFSGRCTAEQCADAMQSRLEIYLSEHYG